MSKVTNLTNLTPEQIDMLIKADPIDSTKKKLNSIKKSLELKKGKQ